MERPTPTTDDLQPNPSVSQVAETLSALLTERQRQITEPILATNASGSAPQENAPNSDDDPNVLLRNSTIRRSNIDKQAYARLHTTQKEGRRSVDRLKGRFESLADNSADKETEAVSGKAGAGSVAGRGGESVLAKITDNIDELQKKLSAREAVDSLKLKYSPAGYGYPKASKRSSLPAKPSVTEKPRPPVPPKRVASLRCSNQCPVRTNVENVQPTTTETDSVVTKLRRPRNSLQFLVQVDAGNVKSTSAETAYKQPRTTTEPIVVEAKLPEQQLASKSPVLDTENASLETEPVELRRSTQCPESVTSTIVQPDIVDAKLRQTRHHSLQFPIETVQFASPEEQHFIVRQSSSEDSLEALESFLADFTMDKKQPKEKKRSSSFRKILTGGLFGKDKKKTDLEKQLEVERKSDRGKKKTKKTENAVFSDNVQNEHTFNRNAAKRHTLDHQPKADHKSKAAEAKLYYEGVALNEDERRYAEKHINQFNQIKANFSTLEKKFPVEEYISMDSADGKKPKENNYMNSPIDKYIDTSSSSNTLDSENRLTYENALIAQAEMKQLREMEIKKENQLKARQRVIDRNGSPERFSQTPPRSQETYQNLQLIKPKALIPINSERPLPNPYHNGQDDARLEPYVQAKTIERNLNFDGKEYPSKPNMYRQQDIYGAVYDKKSVPSKQYSPNLTKSGSGSPYTNSPNSPTARSSPKSPTLEGSKLRLPPNREKVELQPRIKSPIPQSKISTDKIIATELLKNKAETKKGDKRSSPSHQRLEIDIDYPENDLSECKQVNTYANKNARVRSPTYLDPNKSPQEATLVPDAFEAARWQQKQRELAKSPSLITDDSSSQITTDATVHVDSPTMRNNPMYTSLPPSSRSRPLTRENVQMRQRSVTPVRRIPSTASLQQSPNKQEMRQSVEIFCWKELQKLKERQDQELLCQLQYTPYGFVEDPVIIRRSRSVEPNQQRGRRSASLPREARPVQAERNVTGRSYYREAIPENRPIIYGENDIYAQKNPNFTRGSPQRRTADNTTREKYYGSVDAPYKPIFNRGSLHPQTVLEMQSQMNKKVSFSNVQNAANPQPWPTRNGYVQSPPQRRVEKHMSVDSDDVFLPNDINQLKEINRQMSKDVVEPPHTSRQSRKTPGNVDQLYGSKLSVNKQHVAESYGSTQTLGHQKDVTDDPYVTRRDVARMRRPQNIYGNAPIQTQNEVNQSYSSRQNLADYGTRQNQQNLIDAYQRNNQKVSNETRQKLINESPYGTRQNQQVLSESPYGTRQNQQVLNESPYGTRQNQQVVNESPYRTRQNQQVLNDSPCGTGSPKESPYGIRQESPYGTKQNQQNLTKIEYGMKHNQSIESPYGTRVLNEPVYVTRTSQQVLNESPYATRANQNVANMLKQNQQVLNESPYGTRQVARSRPIEDQQSLNGPTRNQEVFLESPYGTRQSVRQNEIAKEPSYGTRREMPPSGTPLYASKQSIAENPYGRSGPKQITVSEKVCDMYGKIHDSGSRKAVSPTNYNQVQQTGVIYGQLQTNNPVLGRPPQHQSYNQIPNNFPRGTRLTASANDMYKRYQIDPRHRSDIVYEDRVYQQRAVTEFNPDAPLPPTPNESKTKLLMMRRAGAKSNQPISDTESDTSEVRSIMNRNYLIEEEWNSDGKSGRGIPGSESGSGRGENDIEIRGRSRNTRRDDPRRHTLAGDQQYGSMDRQGGPLSRTMDLEGQPRGYPPPTNPMLFDDDPGIMSEVETSSTGFRRGGKQRSSLPVVRTPSKTLERPLGLVFLQYRNETKRALLPNEITSIDTVKALFVRSFPKQLTMEYLDSPQVKIYIHDSSKDMFYELEDLRSHLREIRDRSVLRLFESADVSGGLPMAGIGIAGGVGHFEDPSYFSEPEFDSEYQHQHIHKSKGSATKAAPYYMGSTASLPRSGLLRAYSPAVAAIPPERIKTLPTGAPPKPQRAYASGTRSSDGPPRPPDRFAPFQRPANSLFAIPDGYMSSPERGSRYEDPYYSQYTTRSGSITPVIDEEVSDTELLDESYSLYGVKLPAGGPRATPRTGFPPPAAVPYDTTRIRVENMERQLANLTGLVQKALTQTPATLQVPGGRGDNYRTDKSVSFEKSVSFSDEPPDMNSPKQHSPQHTADTKPTKPAIKSSTLPRTSSQERDRLKPAPPPKPASLSPGQYDGRHIYRDLQLTPEMYNQLRGLQKKAKDLRAEVRNLRRMSQAQAHSVRETIRDTFIKIRAMLLAGGEQVWQAGMDQERVRLSREEDLYKQEMLRLEKDLSDLESTVEELRGNVINRKTRVNMSDVENMALILSKSSKTVADLKLRFPSLQDSMKSFLSSEMEKVVREEKFLKEEPERLESALRRCKKLTGTLVTLKRLASVQEQRLPCSTSANDGRLSPSITDTPPITPTSAQHSKPTPTPRVGQIIVGGDGSNPSDSNQRPENALDALLDELQTFSKPHPSTVSTQMPQVSYTESDPPTLPIKGIPPSHSSHFSHTPSMSEIGRKGSMDSATILPTQNLTVSTATGSLRRLHSYPSGSDTDNSPPIQPLQRVQLDSKPMSGKPPLPERNTELLQHISGKRIPPPPPPRTSSKSPLASPTSPSLPPRSPATGLQHIQNVQNMVEKPQSQFETATQNLGLGTLRRNVANRASIKDRAQTLPRNIGSNLQVQIDVDNAISASNSSSCESVNSQDGTKKRKEELEQRHQELLKKQKALQEQYARLQQLQRGNNTLAVIPPAPDQLLKKTGSESNLLQKMGLQMSAPQMTGSLTNLPNTGAASIRSTNVNSSTNTQNNTGDDSTASSTTSSTTTSKVYETDIL